MSTPETWDKIYDNFGYIIEIQKYKSFELSENSNIFIRPSLDMQSTNLGLFFIYDKISNLFYYR